MKLSEQIYACQGKAVLAVSEALFPYTEDERERILESALAMIKGMAPKKRGRPPKSAQTELGISE